MSTTLVGLPLTIEETVIIDPAEVEHTTELVYAMVGVLNVLAADSEQIYVELAAAPEEGENCHRLSVLVKDDAERAIDLLADIIHKAHLEVAPFDEPLDIEPWPGILL